MKTRRTRRSQISRLKALELMQESKGRFFTTTFIKKNGEERTINGKYQGLSKLGYVRVAEHDGGRLSGKNLIKNVNLQTISALKIGGKTCRVV